MSARLRNLSLGLALASVALASTGQAGLALAADPPVAAAPRPPQSVALRVVVDAQGQVQAAQPLDAAMAPALLQAGTEIARKLKFTPATKDGRPVKSETTLSLVLALEPRAAGSFGIVLRRATNGPSLLEMGKSPKPNVGGRENGGLVIVGVDLRPDGTVDMETFKAEKVELRVPSSFAEERFVDSARNLLKGTRFQLDLVDGIGTPARISVPFQFNGGPGKRKPGEDEKDAEKRAADTIPPGLTAVSKIEGVVLPKIDYTAPAK